MPDQNVSDSTNRSMRDELQGNSSISTASVTSLPHFAVRADNKGSTLRPPAKPFFKATSAQKSLNEKAALERPSGDRAFIERMGVMAPTSTYTPPPQRRTTEIPNLKSVREAAEAKSDANKLTITKRIKVSGEISGCERLVVEGCVDAVMIGLKKIEVAVGGKAAGKADVESAIINGRFDGTLIVRGHLEIAAGAHVSGAISYKSVSVAVGGSLTGTVTLLDA
ncbi:MAG: polymer-forming cytoskeletal protein [Rhodospirillaceae bacterium]|nr:polymer-forming cytoskeletal protein [Rhodospirillaceae bacterium]